MTPSPRTAALSIIAVYWLMLILGMGSCIAMRADASIAAIWTGTVAGTVLGHALALVNTRTWFALLTILTVTALVGPSAPGELSATTLWLAFMPAAACAYWSLGDRTTLIAFWFPAVIWMLSILDRARANGSPDDTGIALLGVLALLFLLFLRVRETRRVALWTTVASPSISLAEIRPAVLLKDRPGLRIARTGWALVASVLAFGATAWVAPRMWKPETLAGEHHHVATGEPEVGGGVGGAVQCCPLVEGVERPRARVKEYFGIGRGHDDGVAASDPERSCRRCEGHGERVATRGDYNGEPITPYYPSGIYDRPELGTGGYSGGSYTYSEGSHAYSDGSQERAPVAGGTTPDVTAPPNPPVMPTPYDAPFETEHPRAEPAYAPPAYVDRTYTPPTVTPPSPPAVAEPAMTPPTLPAPVTPAPSIDTSPPPVAPAPPPREPEHAQSPPSTAAATSAQPSSAGSPPTFGPSLMQWIGVVLAAALLLQLIALALRPLRRLVTLRHLRRPYWEETVDQRVSNAWQLALVGLRDAGWRADSQESPRDLAHRVGIDGVERCAQILERARHGVGIDAEDLSTMTASAQDAYHDARRRLGPVARAATWMRWPLT